MTYAIHASREGESVVTIRISPAVAIDKARTLQASGWQVHVTDSTGHQIDPRDFDRFLALKQA
jgi:predicted esterase